MANKILLGPLLGFEGEDGDDVRLSVVIITTRDSERPRLEWDGEEVPFEPLAVTRFAYWRAQVRVGLEAQARACAYRILGPQPLAAPSGHDSWSVHIRGNAPDAKPPRLSYASCSGFSDARGKLDTEAFAMWTRLKKSHETAPLSLLILGGDQIYADSIWSEAGPREIQRWLGRSFKDRFKVSMTKAMREQVERFYEDLYISRWSQPDMAWALATIPHAMMWDDHDIYDGWGSFLKCSTKPEGVLYGIYLVARTFFERLQVRGRQNPSLLDRRLQEDDHDETCHYSWQVDLAGYRILALDNRSRRTPYRVMDDEEWVDVEAALANAKPQQTLLILSAVPVLHRSFEHTEAFSYDNDDLVDPQANSLADDLRDHWRSKHHQGERQKLIMNVLDSPSKRKVFLSGDVHVGACGVIEDEREELNLIHQVTSSGIVHPPPTWLEWRGILIVSNDRDEQLEPRIHARMLRPKGSSKYIRDRNFVTLQERGSAQKLWVYWHRESEPDRPASHVIS